MTWGKLWGDTIMRCEMWDLGDASHSHRYARQGGACHRYVRQGVQPCGVRCQEGFRQWVYFITEEFNVKEHVAEEFATREFNAK